MRGDYDEQDYEPVSDMAITAIEVSETALGKWQLVHGKVEHRC